MATFTLPEAVKERTQVILGKFPFVDGVFKTTNDAAQHYKLQLCRDYECTVEFDVESPAEETPAEGAKSVSLEKTVTKTTK